jgi:hypothetical protein
LNGWWYKGCATCKRGLNPTFDGFECTNCDETQPTVIPRYPLVPFQYPDRSTNLSNCFPCKHSYKLSVVIEDGTGRVKIFLFGGVAEQVVRRTAADLVEESSSN